jgi:hypothetical protein
VPPPGLGAVIKGTDGAPPAVDREASSNRYRSVKVVWTVSFRTRLASQFSVAPAEANVFLQVVEFLETRDAATSREPRAYGGVRGVKFRCEDRIRR